MSKKTVILVTLVVLLVIPTLMMFIYDANVLGSNLQDKNCSPEIESLILCVDDSKIVSNLGEPVVINLIWINKSESERYLGRQSLDYSVEIRDREGEKLVPTFVKKESSRQERIAATSDSGMTEEDLKEMRRRARRGSGRGIDVQGYNQANDQIKLTAIDYDYDFAKKGKYEVIVKRSVPSLEEGKTIEFVLENIAIELK